MSKKQTPAPAPAPAARAVAPAPAPAARAVVVSAPDHFEADAGMGMEGTTVESFAIPFLLVLQSLSPQVDEAGGTAIEGARPGMF